MCDENKVLNFVEGFYGSKKKSIDIEKSLGFDFDLHEDYKVGYVYNDSYYISQIGFNQFHLHLSNVEYQSRNIKVLEAILLQYAMSEENIF